MVALNRPLKAILSQRVLHPGRVLRNRVWILLFIDEGKESTRTLRCSHQHRLRAMRAPLRLDRNLAQTLGTLSCSRRSRRSLLMHARHQPVHGKHDKEIYRGGDQQERNDRVEKVADQESATPKFIFKIREV